jgi:hypothetical protein
MAINPPQFDRPEIPFAKVLARLGYAQGKTALDPKTAALIDEELGVAQKLITGRQTVAFSKIHRLPPDRVELEPGLNVQSVKIFQLLEGCEKAYGFAVTIGPALEEKRNRYIDAKETTRAVILDAIGSVAADELAELTHRQLAADAAQEGMTATRRFSPGYGDWPLTSQQTFLHWLGAAAIGIRLTENCQMLPEKSVSALLGFKPVR